MRGQQSIRHYSWHWCCRHHPTPHPGRRWPVGLSILHRTSTLGCIGLHTPARFAQPQSRTCQADTPHRNAEQTARAGSPMYPAGTRAGTHRQGTCTPPRTGVGRCAQTPGRWWAWCRTQHPPPPAPPTVAGRKRSASHRGAQWGSRCHWGKCTPQRMALCTWRWCRHHHHTGRQGTGLEPGTMIQRHSSSPQHRSRRKPG